jgi:hypothetical protein
MKIEDAIKRIKSSKTKLSVFLCGEADKVNVVFYDTVRTREQIADNSPAYIGTYNKATPQIDIELAIRRRMLNV